MIRSSTPFRPFSFRPMGRASQVTPQPTTAMRGMSPVAPAAPTMDPGTPPMGGALNLLTGMQPRQQDPMQLMMLMRGLGSGRR